VFLQTSATPTDRLEQKEEAPPSGVTGAHPPCASLATAAAREEAGIVTCMYTSQKKGEAQEEERKRDEREWLLL